MHSAARLQLFDKHITYELLDRYLLSVSVVGGEANDSPQLDLIDVERVTPLSLAMMDESYEGNAAKRKFFVRMRHRTRSK